MSLSEKDKEENDLNSENSVKEDILTDQRSLAEHGSTEIGSKSILYNYFNSWYK